MEEKTGYSWWDNGESSLIAVAGLFHCHRIVVHFRCFIFRLFIIVILRLRIVWVLGIHRKRVNSCFHFRFNSPTLLMDIRRHDIGDLELHRESGNLRKILPDAPRCFSHLYHDHELELMWAICTTKASEMSTKLETLTRCWTSAQVKIIFSTINFSFPHHTQLN